MKYVTTDIHGCFDEFMKLLELINFSNEDTMYILGDNVDRGPYPVKLLLYIYEHDNIISLLDNHEQFIFDYLNNPSPPTKYLWEQNGGDVTRKQLEQLQKDDEELYNNLIEYIKTWDLYMVVDNYILSHAGYNGVVLRNIPSNLQALDRMTDDDFLWSREEFFKCKGIDGYITLFGHTPTGSIRRKFSQTKLYDVWYDTKYGDKIGLDGGIVFEQQLNCICLDTQEIFFIYYEEDDLDD